MMPPCVQNVFSIASDSLVVHELHVQQSILIGWCLTDLSAGCFWQVYCTIEPRVFMQHPRRNTLLSGAGAHESMRWPGSVSATSLCHIVTEITASGSLCHMCSSPADCRTG